MIIFWKMKWLQFRYFVLLLCFIQIKKNYCVSNDKRFLASLSPFFPTIVSLSFTTIFSPSSSIPFLFLIHLHLMILLSDKVVILIRSNSFYHLLFVPPNKVSVVDRISQSRLSCLPPFLLISRWAFPVLKQQYNLYFAILHYLYLVMKSRQVCLWEIINERQ